MKDASGRNEAVGAQANGGARIAFVIGVVAAVTCLAFLLHDAVSRRETSPYAGSSSCRECHETFYQKWAPSHHGRAMQPVTPELVKELTPLAQPVVIRDYRYTVDLEHRRMTEEPVAGGAVRRYPMIHAMGGKNLYYFLTLLDKGKLQVLPLAYHLKEKRWYDTTDSMVRHFREEGDQALTWRDPLLTFNTACHSCHVSQLSKNYDTEHDRYHTTWREPGISCESCHGPGEEHNRVCRALPKGVAPTNLCLVSWRTFTPAQVNSACAPCHAKMSVLTSGFQPGDSFFDHYDIACLEDNDFSADGRDRGENYTYTLWLMNPCAKAGKLDCMHCHTSSGRYRFATNDVNGACASCHADKAANIQAHTHHAVQGPAGRCIACHMPMTSFAGMRRSDHSQRPPCPEAAAKFGYASACILCHKEKNESWAADHVRAWHPDSVWRPKMLREGGLVEAARNHDWTHLQTMLAYVKEPSAEPVVCASLLRLLRGCPDAAVWPAARASLGHASPLVRSAAAALLSDDLREPETARALLGQALADPVRVVRVRAAFSLAAYPRRNLDAATLKRLDAAEKELLAMFDARPDDWASHYNLGNYRVARGDESGAMEAYQAAMRLRPDAVMPLVNAAVLASQGGRIQEAIGYLQTACKASPEHGAVNLNLGLALAETGDLAGAERHLRQAMHDPACKGQAAYNCAVLVGSRAPAEAVELCRAAVTSDPQNTRYTDALQYYLKMAGMAGQP